jgi:DHA3 family macrolide efflux protein-like MFS transporter
MEQTRQRRWQIPFFTTWVGQAVSLLGSMLVQFALVWWLTETTRSAMVLATATLMALLPGVFVAPFAGALVDRWNRRVVMIAVDAAIALVTVGLAYLFAVEAIHLWHIYAAMFIRAAGGAFHWTAMQASTSLMVPEEHLPRVAGLNQTLHGVMNIVSPPLGAFLIGIFPLQAVLAIDVGTAAIAITLLFFVHIPQPERQVATEKEGGSSLLQDMKAGLRYVANWPGLCALGVIAMVINFLFNPAFSLLPLLVTEHFGGEAVELGWIQSAWGIGVVVGGLVLSVWGGFRRRMLTSLVGLVGMGVGTLLIGLTPGTLFWLAVGAMFFAGFMNPITNGPIFAIVQAKVAPEMQGRVFTLMQSMSTAISPLSMVVAGPVAELLGIRVWYVVAGVVSILMGVGSIFVPVVMHLEDNHNGHAAVVVKAQEAATVPVYVKVE